MPATLSPSSLLILCTCSTVFQHLEINKYIFSSKLKAVSFMKEANRQLPSTWIQCASPDPAVVTDTSLGNQAPHPHTLIPYPLSFKLKGICITNIECICITENTEKLSPAPKFSDRVECSCTPTIFIILSNTDFRRSPPTPIPTESGEESHSGVLALIYMTAGTWTPGSHCLKNITG